tara:strand:- start:5061 stop:5501 length:441 start_codon:yes stop_codon:yes gene_type:complete
MKEKNKELLDNLKNIVKPVAKQPVIKPISNQYGEDEKGRPIYIDRLYGDLFGHHILVQKNGTQYKGKISKKRRTITHKDYKGNKNKFFSTCYVTADGRWFDNCGMPIDAPKKVEEEETTAQVEVQKVDLTADEKLANEQNFLKGLK